jgi:hypothetical protein
MALLFALTAPPAVKASAYAYSLNSIFDFRISNVAVFDHQTSSAFNVAEFAGFGVDVVNGPIDPRQAQSGPGPFPPENRFSPQGGNGQFARADNLISSTSILSMQGLNVAEAFRSSPGQARASSTTTLQFGITRTSDADPVAIFFDSAPSMVVQSELSGESSIARLAFSVTFYEHGTRNQLLQWTPNGDPLHDFTFSAGVVTNVKDPFSLNKTIVCLDACFTFYDLKGEATGWGLDYRLGGGGQQFDVEVNWRESVDVTAVGSTPEPASISLVFPVLVTLAVSASARRLMLSRTRGLLGRR